MTIPERRLLFGDENFVSILRHFNSVFVFHFKALEASCFITKAHVMDFNAS